MKEKRQFIIEKVQIVILSICMSMGLLDGCSKIVKEEVTTTQVMETVTPKRQAQEAIHHEGVNQWEYIETVTESDLQELKQAVREIFLFMQI